jgi:hypothetical protein
MMPGYNPSSGWESFTTFLDQINQQGQRQESPQPGQMQTWGDSFQLGQRPNYAYSPDPASPGGFLPGIPTEPQVPGAQQVQSMNFNAGRGGEHNTLQAETIANTNPMAGFMQALGQGDNFARRRAERQQRRNAYSGGFGTGGYKKNSRWNTP